MGETHGFWRHLATVVALSVIALAVMFTLFRMSGALSLGGSYKVGAVVPQAGSLTIGSSVTMAGARVGVVTGVKRRGVGALADIRIDDKAVVPLPKDSHARLSVRTPLGENYVELLPGDSNENLPEGSIVPTAPGSEYVDVDQILSTLHGKTRDRARQTIHGLAAAVRNRGQELNTTVHRAAGLLDSGSEITAQLKGERERIGRLVEQLGDLTRAVGERGESVRALATQGLTTFAAIAEREDSVRTLLEELPATLRQVRSTTQNLGSLSDTGTPVVANLATALRELEPAVRRLQPAGREGRAVIRHLSAAAPRLQGTLRAIGPLASRAASALPELEKVLCEANPALRYAQPYTRDIVSLVEGFGSASNSYDAIGHTIRLMPIFGENSAMGLPEEISKSAYDLVQSGLFGEAVKLGFRPYPEPGLANTSVTDADVMRGPKEYYEKGGRYPRVTADC